MAAKEIWRYTVQHANFGNYAVVRRDPGERAVTLTSGVNGRYARDLATYLHLREDELAGLDPAERAAHVGAMRKDFDAEMVRRVQDGSRDRFSKDLARRLKGRGAPA